MYPSMKGRVEDQTIMAKAVESHSPQMNPLRPLFSRLGINDKGPKRGRYQIHYLSMQEV